MTPMEWMVRDRTVGHGITAYRPLKGQQQARARTRTLTVEQVRELRAACAAGATRRALSELYGLDRGTIGKIARGDIYRDVE